MKSLILFILVMSTLLKCSNATNVSGNISSNTTWNLAGSPYKVTGDVFVDENVTLTIEPGVVVMVDSNKAIVVNGTIIAIGTATNLIYFEPSNPSPVNFLWAGIYLSKTSQPYNAQNQTGCYFKYCYISYAGTFNKYSDVNGGYVAVKSENSLGFEYCSIVKSYCGLSGSSASVVSYSQFRGNTADANSGVLIKVGQNSVIHHNLIYDNAVSNASGMMSSNKNIKIFNNIFVKNSFLFTAAISFSDSCQFYNNTFVENFIVSSSSFFKISKSSIYQNTFYNNAIESQTFLNQSTGINFYNNNVFYNLNENSGNEVEMVAAAGTGLTTIAENNYWGSADSAEIADIIKDSANDGNLCTIDFVPFNFLPDSLAPVIPPLEVIKEDLLNGKIKISWRKNIDADLKGYKVYYGNFTGYSFSNMFDAGSDTTAEITWGNVNDEIGVTAYDHLANGVSDQYNGNESWFTLASLFVGTHQPDDASFKTEVFPNPSNGEVFIRLPLILQTISTNIVITHMEGQKVQQFNSINQPLITSFISRPGIYVIQIMQGDHMLSHHKICVLR